MMQRGAAAATIFGMVLSMTAAARLDAAEPPRRVVSVNLCTDQLALLLAAPGQLVSVSRLAHDPTMAALAEAAQRIPANSGKAEEIYLLRPDLVLAGTYTTRQSLDMLRRLGIRVEAFPPEQSLDDIRRHIRHMGALLGREAAAEALLARFEADLAVLARPRTATSPLAAVYFGAAGTAGRDSLVDAVLAAAGWRNLAAEIGVVGVGLLPLERLVVARPDAVIGEAPDPGGPALAHASYRHPGLLAAIRSATGVTVLPDRLTICGGPFTLEAVRQLRALGDRVATARPPAAGGMGAPGPGTTSDIEARP